MDLPARIDTVVVGAGQCGLAASRLLSDARREHVVLERRETLGGGWQDRWDSFRLVTPNWTSALPGYPYDGDDPDGYMPRDEIAGRIARYADVVGAPVRLGVEVIRLTDGGEGFRVATTAGDLRADHVIVASGPLHRPVRPPIAAELPARLTQLHTHDYRNERALPPGGVLVVGSGQSGIQIAEELLDGGRQTYLAGGFAGWAPRRYRGRDIFGWLWALASDGPRVGIPFPTVETLPDPRLRFAANPQLTGHGGGHDVDLRALAERGLGLVGRVTAVDGERVSFAPGLDAALARSEGAFEERFRPLIDRYIERAGVDAPPWQPTRSSFAPPELADLDLGNAGVSTVIWATGYRPDYGWIDLPIFDEHGLPRHRRGVSEVPGLGFLGLLWQHTQASVSLYGPTLDGPPLVEGMGLLPEGAVSSGPVSSGARRS
jgi:putative flavoprotein involved in K+ transport